MKSPMLRKSSRMFRLALLGLIQKQGSSGFLSAVLDKALKVQSTLEDTVEDLIGSAKYLEHRQSELLREGFTGEELEHLGASIKDLKTTIGICMDKIRAIETLLKDPSSAPPGEYVELGVVTPSEVRDLQEALSQFSSMSLLGYGFL